MCVKSNYQPSFDHRTEIKQLIMRTWHSHNVSKPHMVEDTETVIIPPAVKIQMWYAGLKVVVNTILSDAVLFYR